MYHFDFDACWFGRCFLIPPLILRAPIGKTKAIVAVSHTMEVNFYHMITKRIPYQELGANYFDTFDRERLTKHAVKRLEALGYEATLTQRRWASKRADLFVRGHQAL